ncbi:uncharacterized protein LOC127714386 [Mytilus californianus]|uniref:uncharacterized protein LOC127714386 n=1 Tax=Mytilus californianus TaxID=6549 RepID=UPI0022467D6C|nr:uncharacterized protein LOC127714386 [Mytilus californianus]
MKTKFFLSILCFGIMTILVKGDPCMNYKVLDSLDESRRSAAKSSGHLCDNTLESGWYRIISKAGERMPTECIVGGFRCGTISSIWMNGSYPVTNETRAVTACAANYNGNCCAYSHPIKVKNCTNYLVYSLVPVTPCYQAYCFGSELPCPTGETSDNGFSPGCELDPCHSSNYDILQGELKRSSNYTLTINDVAIEDSRLRTGWYRIDSVTGNDIVNYSVPMMQCGTLYPLWMKGSIPDDRERGKTVNRKVCRSGLTGTCVQEYNIKVRNCGTYRTYYLTQLDVDKSAYCFGMLPVPKPTTLTTTTRSTTTTKTTTTTPRSTTTTTTVTPTKTSTTLGTARTTRAKSVSSISTNTSEEISTTSSLIKQTTSHLPQKDEKDESFDFLSIVAALIVLVFVLLIVIIAIFILFRLKPRCLKDIMRSSPPTYEDTVKTDKMTNLYTQMEDTNHYSCIKDNNYNEGYEEIPYDKNQTVPENKLYFQNIATMAISTQIVQENRLYLQNPITVPLDSPEKSKI